MNNGFFSNIDKLILQPNTTRSLIDIPNDVNLTAESMAKNLVATFLPEIEGPDKVRDFGARLKVSMLRQAGSTGEKEGISRDGSKIEPTPVLEINLQLSLNINPHLSPCQSEGFYLDKRHIFGL